MTQPLVSDQPVAPRQPVLSRRRRERLADWLIICGAVGLLLSLFLPWSHQFSPAFLAQWGATDQLRGVPHDPTAWQVYSAVDVIFAVLAVALVAIALIGGRAVRLGAVVGVGLALVFTVHARSAPPTNGANIFDPSLIPPRYTPNAPAPGTGETVAIAGLGVALAGLLLSFTAD